VGISSGSQQLTSGFSGANIGMASAQFGGKGLKHPNKVYLNSIDSLHYVTHSEKSSRAGFKIIGSL
jgi:hypothetical protein